MPRSPFDKPLLFATGLFVGLALGLPGGAWLTESVRPTETSAPSASSTAPGVPFGVDQLIEQATGKGPVRTAPASLSDLMMPPEQPAEDDPAFDCRIHGDLVCGPTNVQGVPAGLYSPDGVLIEPWPTVRSCHTIGVITSCADVPVHRDQVHFGQPEQGPVR